MVICIPTYPSHVVADKEMPSRLALNNCYMLRNKLHVVKGSNGVKGIEVLGCEVKLPLTTS